MNTSQNTMNAPRPFVIAQAQSNIYAVMLSEIQTWMNAVASRKDISEQLVNRCADVKASSVITAEVAMAAGELSLLGEQLALLSGELNMHHRNLQELYRERNSIPESTTRHDLLHRKVVDIEQRFRGLLWKLYKLEECAYRKFIS